MLMFIFSKAWIVCVVSEIIFLKMLWEIINTLLKVSELHLSKFMYLPLDLIHNNLFPSVQFMTYTMTEWACQVGSVVKNPPAMQKT